MRFEKWFTKENVGKSAAILLLFNVLDNFMLLVRGVVFARWLGPKEYGVFTLAFFFIPLMVALAKLGVPSSFARYIPKYEMQGALKEFIRRTFLLVLGGGVLLLLIGLLANPALARLLYGSPAYGGIIILCALSILPDAMKESLSATFAGLRVFFLDASLRVGQSVLLTVCGLMVVMFYSQVKWLLAVNLFTTLLVVAFFGWILQRHLAEHTSQREEIREPKFYGRLFMFSSAYVISPVVAMLFTYSDRWVLSHLMDLTSVGIYSVGSRISGLIYTFGLVASTVIVPNLSRHWELGNRPRVNSLLNLSTKANILLLLGGALLILLGKDVLIPLLFGRQYAGCIPLIGPLLIFWLLQCITATIAGYASLVEKTYIPLLCTTVGLSANVALNLLLIPQMGMLGAAYAGVFSSFIILSTLCVWLSVAGLQLAPATLFFCLTPGVLLLPPWLAVGVYLLLLTLGLITDWLLNKEEREYLFGQFQGIIKTMIRGIGGASPQLG